MFVALSVIWYAGNVLGGDLSLQTGPPKDNVFFKALSRPFPIFGLNNNAVLPRETALLHPFGTDKFIDFAYNFGTITTHLYFNYDYAGNKDGLEIGNTNTQKMVGASIDYKMNDFFYIIPMFSYYDWGKQSGVASRPGVNNEWIGGLHFRFVF